MNDDARRAARVEEIMARYANRPNHVIQDVFEAYDALLAELARIERGESHCQGLAPHFYGHACQIAHEALGHGTDSYLHCEAALIGRPRRADGGVRDEPDGTVSPLSRVPRHA